MLRPVRPFRHGPLALWRSKVNSDLVYDFGLHRGEDTEFYLRKGYRVIAVEANPQLIEECKLKYCDNLAAGRLQIVEGAIAPPSSGDYVTFYRNTRASIWGTIEQDWADRNAARGFESEAIELPRIDMPALFARFGIPHYVKIDIEGADVLVLNALKEFPERPHYLSIEAEKVDFDELINEFDLLEQLGYTKFKVVQQQNIPGRTIRVRAIDGSPVEYTFKECASGPFGEDIPQPWLSRTEAIKLYEGIFARYRMFGDRTTYYRLPRVAKGVISTAYKAATGYRGPLPGWFDTHASL